ncbi:DsrE family protein [Candidatus Micrarchaeota archaeon]|nr:DsrE family protein [Candidatus Micrarchaeota archaeon]
MKLGIVISTDEAEAVWNALRLANLALSMKDDVAVFLVGRGVDYEKTSEPQFDNVAETQKLVESGGRLMACGTCLKSRGMQGSNICPVSSLGELYRLVRDSDKVISF